MENAAICSKVITLTSSRTRTHVWIGLAIAAVLIGWPCGTFARLGSPPLSSTQKVLPLTALKPVVLPAIDPAKQMAMDAAFGPLPLRFADPIDVSLTPDNSGSWEAAPGGSLWRLRVQCSGATDLNFGFTRFWLPEGATLHISSETEPYFQGPYAARDNKEHHQLWTPVVPGDSAVIELFVPETAAVPPVLELTRVNRGYRDMFHKDVLAVAKAGTCNIDVVCPQGAPWTNEIRSVARYTVGGGTLCSGTLLNNTAGDERNFFLTANHCGITAGNAASVVVYWNYQSPTCGAHGGGSLAQNQSGSVFRAARSDADFALVELEDVPESAFNVYYAGWDGATNASFTGAVGIHHPNGDEKSISFCSNIVTTTDNCIGSGFQTHYNVVWTRGVTEQGSSGSGLWNMSTHRLVGTLSGGDSDCTTPFGPDCYGRVSAAWATGGSAASRLRDWLDPLGTGATSVEGMNPLVRPKLAGVALALVSETCGITNSAVDPGETVTLNFFIQNAGTNDSGELTGTLISTGGVTSLSGPQAFGTLTAGGAAVSRPFTLVTTGECGSVVSAILHFQSGTTNIGDVAFVFILGNANQGLSENFDALTPPALPLGWSQSSLVAGNSWATTGTNSLTPFNSVFAGDPGTITDTVLVSPPASITTTNARLTFFHRYTLEAGNAPDGFDGGVLEISVNGGAFADITTRGTFVSGGYSHLISTQYGNPLGGRNAWSGASSGFASTVVRLFPTVAGNSVRFRWRLATDNSNSDTGWYVDTVSLVDGATCCSGVSAPKITSARYTGPSFVFSFNSLLGHSYISEAATALGTNTIWTPFQTNTGTGGIQFVTNAGPAQIEFIRVRVE